MPSLFAAEEREAKLSKLGEPLESLNRQVDFTALAAAEDRALARPHSQCRVAVVELWSITTSQSNLIDFSQITSIFNDIRNSVVPRVDGFPFRTLVNRTGIFPRQGGYAAVSQPPRTVL